MYNDDCILDTTTNTVIFDFEDKWNNYLNWKSTNDDSDKQDFNKRKNILLWNGGLPHNVKDFKLFYEKDGCLHKRVEKNKTTYLSNSKIYKEEISKDNKIIREKNYSENEILYREVDYIEKIFTEYDINTGLINSYKKTKGEFTYETYYKDSILYKSVLIKNNITLRVKEMFPHSKIVKQKTIYLFDSLYEYTDYYKNSPKDVNTLNGSIDEFRTCQLYITGSSANENISKTNLMAKKKKENIRSKGTLNSKGKPDGDWSFYHHNGNIESKHKFKNGKLIDTSTLFYESGKPYKEINHD